MLLPLNAFLLKAGIGPLDAFTDRAKYTPRVCQWDGMTLIDLDPPDEPLAAAVSGDMVVMLFRRPKAPQQWQVLFAQNFGTDLPPIGTADGGIIFCAVEESGDTPDRIRWVAWTFGLGSRTISRLASDPRFGLLAALNMVVGSEQTHAKDGDAVGVVPMPRTPQFRDLRYQTTGPYFQRTGHRAARDIPVEGFRIDRAADLVAAIGGRTSSSSLARSVLGGRSLRFRADVADVAVLHKFSAEIVAASRLQSYRSTLPWIDNIRLVEDRELIERLRRQLVELLSDEPVPANVDAILPDDLLEADDERIIAYILFPHERTAKSSRLNLPIERVAQYVRKFQQDPSPTKCLDHPLRFADDAQGILGTATILECICAELALEGDLFVAYDGDFYRVDATFIATIDQQVRELPHTRVSFPRYRGGTEPAYLNEIRRTEKQNFVVLDRQLIKVDGESGIEASDLVTPDGTMVHVKRKGKSSTLSHLFLQAANSGELLRRSSPARQQLAQYVVANASVPELAYAINARHAELLPHQGGIEVVFALLGSWRNRTILSLPLFSRISLVSESKRLRSLGFQPAVALISSM